MPKAIVATMTSTRSIRKSSWLAARVDAVHPGVVGQRPDAVGHEQLGQLLDLLAAQAVDDAALALVLLDEADDVVVDVVLGPDFVVEVRAVERRLENRSVGHAQVLLDVELHLGRGRGRQGDQRRRADLVDDRPDAAVLRTEVMAPLRNAVRLVDGVERNLYLAQERHVVLLGERLGGRNRAVWSCRRARPGGPAPRQSC